jgi:hypothetical protein
VRESLEESSDDFESDEDSVTKVVPADENFQVPPLQPQHFNTWEDFEERFEKYCKEPFQIFKIRTSKTVSYVNERQKNFEYPETCGKYFSKTFICTYGWEPRHRGKLYAIL